MLLANLILLGRLLVELNQLNAKQLKQVIAKANSALNRRQKFEKAMIEIMRVSKKYNLSKNELKALLDSLQSTNAAPSKKSKSARPKVKPKYQSQDGVNKWTGRGRTPVWVVELCRSKGLTVENFKSDRRFLIRDD